MPLHTFENTQNISVDAEPLTPEAFAPYGGVHSGNHNVQTLALSAANYGTAVKMHKVAPIVNNYADCPSGTPALANWNLFRCLYPQRLFTASGLTLRYTAKVLERHPYSTQTFVPMGQPQDTPLYVVIVAESDDSPEKLPVPLLVRAFVCSGNQAVTYGAGVWHAPMVVIDDTVAHVDFAVLIHENGVADEDCQECYFEPGLGVVLRRHSSLKL